MTHTLSASPYSPASIHKGADVNRGQDERPQASAGVSPLSAPYNSESALKPSSQLRCAWISDLCDTNADGVMVGLLSVSGEAGSVDKKDMNTKPGLRLILLTISDFMRPNWGFVSDTR